MTTVGGRKGLTRELEACHLRIELAHELAHRRIDETGLNEGFTRDLHRLRELIGEGAWMSLNDDADSIIPQITAGECPFCRGVA